MSWDATNRVVECSTLRGSSYVVLLMIAKHEGDWQGEPWSWPSQTTLAREARCTVRAVEKGIAAAAEAGELLIDRAPWERRSNRYRVLVGRTTDEQGSGIAEAKPEQSAPIPEPRSQIPEPRSGSLERTEPTEPKDNGGAPRVDVDNSSAPVHDPVAEALLAPDSRAQYLVSRLKERDERWSQLRPAWLMKLGRAHGAAVVIEALSYVYEQADRATAPYPYLDTICRRITERGAPVSPGGSNG